MITAGVQALNLGAAFAGARRHILLSAPPYGAFAASGDIREALESVLSHPRGPSLTAVDLPDPEGRPWMEELRNLLRPGGSVRDFRRELDESRLFLRELSRRFPGRVFVRQMRTRPCLPVIIVDDSIFFGHFAHGPVMTPEGFWCCVTAPVGPLFAHAAAGTAPDALMPENRAAFRIVSECVHTLRQAVNQE